MVAIYRRCGKIGRIEMTRASELARDLEEIRRLVHEAAETDRILPILDAVIGMFITQSDLERDARPSNDS